jgi:hypothetical protein
VLSDELALNGALGFIESDSVRATNKKLLASHYYVAMQYTRHHQTLRDLATILSFIGHKSG